MNLNRIACLFYIVLSVHNVHEVLSDDRFVVKEHFMANLQEETRLIASSKLTEDVENEINSKVEGFLALINEDDAQGGRVRRDTSELLLNEKSESAWEVGILLRTTCFTRTRKAPFSCYPTGARLNT